MKGIRKETLHRILRQAKQTLEYPGKAPIPLLCDHNAQEALLFVAGKQPTFHHCAVSEPIAQQERVKTNLAISFSSPQIQKLHDLLEGYRLQQEIQEHTGLRCVRISISRPYKAEKACYIQRLFAGLPE